MAISHKLLGQDEHIVLELRTHWKALIRPVLVFIIVAAATGFAVAFLPDGSFHGIGLIAIAAIAVLLVLVLCVRRVLDWWFQTYTLTNRRLITRYGILNRSGRDIPLFRINNVSYEMSLLDRILKCGTLVIESAATSGQVLLSDVPNVEQVHLRINDMLFGRDGIHAGLTADRKPAPGPRTDDDDTLIDDAVDDDRRAR